ncbi:HNH endonuclease [Nostoc sp. DedQUE04]|uniref:HNH endonuclease n=1 Tax=Nostoc sp. DedQUE04 TaxID=3075390 RepID=UPI003A1022A6
MSTRDATESLQVHHLTYENHGKEHEHLEDLITLCDDCHKKQHSLVVNNDKD